MNRTDLLIQHLKQLGDRWVEFQDLKLHINKDVFYNFDSEFVAQNLDIPSSARVLDVGTGSGILAIIAARDANHVLAVDILNQAVNCATDNVNRLHLHDKINVINSNLFENVLGKFDVIIFNIPFNPDKMPHHPLEIATFDKDARLLKRFFNEVDNYLTLNGKIILAYASFGKIDVLKKILKNKVYKLTTKNVLRIDNDINQADFFIFEIFRKN